jgi:hypothetical protein
LLLLVHPLLLLVVLLLLLLLLVVVLLLLLPACKALQGGLCARRTGRSTSLARCWQWLH